VIVCFKLKKRRSSRHLSSSSPLSFSFLVLTWVQQPGLYKTFLYSRGKNAMTKDLKLEIWICFSSPITKDWAPLHQTPPNFPHSFTKLSNICDAESVRWKATNVLWASEAEEKCVKDLNFFDFLNVLSSAYLP
jgi:hypothetical protein